MAVELAPYTTVNHHAKTFTSFVYFGYKQTANFIASLKKLITSLAEVHSKNCRSGTIIHKKTWVNPQKLIVPLKSRWSLQYMSLNTYIFSLKYPNKELFLQNLSKWLPFRDPVL